MSEDSSSEVKRLAGLTDVQVAKVNYSWTIKNFSFLPRYPAKIKSSIFSMDPNNEFKWRLRMYPNGCETSSDTHISLFLQLVSPTKFEILAKFDFSIIKADGVIHVLASHRIRPYLQWKSLGYHELIEKNQLMDESNGFLKDDSLTILCEVSVSTGNVVSHQATCEPEAIKPEKNLMRDLGSLLETKCFSDLTLIADGERFQVHKAIISTRSPVFYAMFQHDMIEKNQNEVEIKDTKKKVLEELIRFIYTGKVERLEQIVFDLLAAADKYAIEDLKLMCERLICDRLTVDNAVNALVVADRYNSVALKQDILAFIKLNAVHLVDSFMAVVLNDERTREGFSCDDVD